MAESADISESMLVTLEDLRGRDAPGAREIAMGADDAEMAGAGSGGRPDEDGTRAQRCGDRSGGVIEATLGDGD